MSNEAAHVVIVMIVVVVVVVVERRYVPIRRYVPCQFDATLIVPPVSRRHVTVGSGVPVAAHRSVTLLPSRTTMSVLVG